MRAESYHYHAAQERAAQEKKDKKPKRGEEVPMKQGEVYVLREKPATTVKKKERAPLPRIIPSARNRRRSEMANKHLVVNHLKS